MFMDVMTSPDTDMARKNTPDLTRLMKKNTSGNIDMLIMFVLILYFTQTLGKLFPIVKTMKFMICWQL